MLEFIFAGSLTGTVKHVRAPRNFKCVVSWMCALVAALVLIYFLSAPPIIVRIVETHNRFDPGAPELLFYTPVLGLIETDFGGPVLWYFNRVWHTGMEFDEGEYGPPYAIATYVLIGAGLLYCIGRPFYRTYRLRLHNA
ncbi:MAG TPA: hypothetical protein VFE51_14365 [Verrucomicrobiae bacterium]|nr:hypothetical protein [Verrucomicrobiae bacterium]